jgi:hypothetical protein
MGGRPRTVSAAGEEYATGAASDLNHTVDIVPDVSRNYDSPTTPGYEFDDPFEKKNRYLMGMELLLSSPEMVNG